MESKEDEMKVRVYKEMESKLLQERNEESGWIKIFVFLKWGEKAWLLCLCCTLLSPCLETTDLMHCLLLLSRLSHSQPSPVLLVLFKMNIFEDFDPYTVYLENSWMHLSPCIKCRALILIENSLNLSFRFLFSCNQTKFLTIIKYEWHKILII